MDNSATHDVTLPGCTPTPLAAYLKALAVLRLVSEQREEDARGWWEGDVFVLRSKLDEEELLRFFLESYRPTPVVSPWNGGSGFCPGDQKAGIEAIGRSRATRLAPYRDVLAACRAQVLQALGLRGKPDDEKHQVLLQCRNALPPEALVWLDAAYVLTSDKPKFPPLLGTGGNDGRLDFSNNFMQRLTDLIDVASPDAPPTPDSPAWLSAALLGDGAPRLLKGAAIGQFMPGNAGGANSTSGYEGGSLTNPWDFVLMIEGDLLFAASTSRRLGATGQGQLAFPFTVRSSGSGHGALAATDVSTSRNETWLPMWAHPARLREVSALLGEGRAQTSQRVAADGVDFAKAVARLGVDRGITAFERVGYLRRNGLSFLAVPLGRFKVALRPETELLDEVDRWLVHFRRMASDDHAPSRFGRALRGIDEAIFSVCRQGGHPRWQQLLIALGEAEAALAASPRTTAEGRGAPLSSLSRRWLGEVDDGSVEFRIARALASIQAETPYGPLRANMVPLALAKNGRVEGFARNIESKMAVWGRGDLTSNLAAVLRRRCMEARRRGADHLPLDGSYPASLADVEAFLLGGLDEAKIEGLLRGLNAVRWPSLDQVHAAAPSRGPLLLPAAYAALKLVLLPWPLPLPWSESPVQVRHDPQILSLATAGRLEEAVALAIRRLRSSGLTALASPAPVSDALARRIVAALLTPISRSDAAVLATQLLAPPREAS